MWSRGDLESLQVHKNPVVGPPHGFAFWIHILEAATFFAFVPFAEGSKI